MAAGLRRYPHGHYDGRPGNGGPRSGGDWDGAGQVAETIQGPQMEAGISRQLGRFRPQWAG